MIGHSNTGLGTTDWGMSQPPEQKETCKNLLPVIREMASEGLYHSRRLLTVTVSLVNCFTQKPLVDTVKTQRVINQSS